MSIHINEHQNTLIHISNAITHQHAPADINTRTHEYTSVHISTNQYKSVHISKHQCTLKTQHYHINKDEYVSVCFKTNSTHQHTPACISRQTKDQCTSIHISTHPYTPIHISTSKTNTTHQYRSIHMSTHQLTSVHMRTHQNTSVHINTHQYK